uniref:Mantle gene 8 n=1 Tax=Pinctada fucata TaxID=50426 RepID=Q3YL58_PINFU|nr:mantle gene 8 [Pinctada fucata]
MKGVALLSAIVIIAVIADSEAWLFGSSSSSSSWGSRYSSPSSFSTRWSRYSPSWSSSRYTPSWSSSRYTPSWSSSRYSPSWSSSRSRFSSSRSSFPHDIKSKSGLNSLYNSRVTKVETFERPIRGMGGIKHNGVVATTKDGGRWLIHKGIGYGKSSDTVVTNARHMSSQWKPAGAKSARPGTTIGGLVKAGLANKRWNPWDAKCWDATDGMMKKAGRRKRATC